MTTPHKINLAVHIIAGAVGLFIGCTLLVRAKGTRLHRKKGADGSLMLVLLSLSPLQ